MKYILKSARTRAFAAMAIAAFSPLFVATQSVSATRDTASVQITGTIPPTCSFTTLPSVMNLGELVAGVDKALGAFGFSCNLATSGAVQLTVQSANGALKRDGGNETVAYQVNWSIQGNASASGNPSAWLTPFGFALQSGDNGTDQLGMYSVKLLGPTEGLIAGEYKDTLTYTISP